MVLRTVRPIKTSAGKKTQFKSVYDYALSNWEILKGSGTKLQRLQYIWKTSPRKIWQNICGFPHKRIILLRNDFAPALLNSILELCPLRNSRYDVRIKHRVGNFLQKNCSAEDGIKETHGYFRRNSRVQLFRGKENSRNSIPELFRGREKCSEFRRNRNRSKLSKRNFVPEHFAEGELSSAE